MGGEVSLGGMPGDIRKWIFEDNVTYLQNCLTYGEEYQEFLNKLAEELDIESCSEYEAEAPDGTGQLGLRLLTKHCLEYMCHARDWDLLEPICER